MKPQKYRKRPIIIEAMRFNRWEDAKEIAKWCGGRAESSAKPSDPDDVASFLYIPTLEGVMTAMMGDWIIRGAKGEFYPCKPDIFAISYEPVLRAVVKSEVCESCQ